MAINKEDFNRNYDETKQFLVTRLGVEGAEEEIEDIKILTEIFENYALLISEHALECFEIDPTQENFKLSMIAAFLGGVTAYHTTLKFSGIDVTHLNAATKIGMENLNK